MEEPTDQRTDRPTHPLIDIRRIYPKIGRSAEPKVGFFSIHHYERTAFDSKQRECQRWRQGEIRPASRSDIRGDLQPEETSKGTFGRLLNATLKMFIGWPLDLMSIVKGDVGQASRCNMSSVAGNAPIDATPIVLYDWPFDRFFH